MAIQLISHPFNNVIGFKIDGKIEAKDIDTVVHKIEEQLKTEDKLGIYAEVTNWSGMSLEAFVRDLKFSLKHLKDFDKEVIVSDIQWLKKLAKITNTLFSGIEVRHFSLNEKDKAWDFFVS